MKEWMYISRGMNMSTTTSTTITIARGDGIGPEIMDATLSILRAAEARIVCEEIQVGEQVYLQGNPAGVARDAWDVIRRNRVFLKAPITTPQGGGYKSLNVSARTYLGLYANVRPCVSYAPYVRTKFPSLDVVIIRENEEDVYAGIEYQQSDEVTQCLKLISRPGCEKIIRYAFEYTRHHGREKLTCCTKDNIMKQTDGLFHQVFDEIALEYPEIKTEHLIVDIGAARLADTPENYDVVVLPNLYGDILSDVVAQIAGSVGLAGSSNIGEECAMFEAIHGSAPTIAGQNIANPSGLLHGALMMLHHIGQSDVADRINNAWLCTIEQGVHTADIYDPAHSTRLVGTREFAEAVIANLGAHPKKLHPVEHTTSAVLTLPRYVRKAAAAKKLIGVDLFVHHRGTDANELAKQMQTLGLPTSSLTMITNRGTKVWPNGFSESFCTDHWRCRFEATSGEFTNADIVELLRAADAQKVDVIKTENLYTFDGKRAYSETQGQ